MKESDLNLSASSENQPHLSATPPKILVVEDERIIALDISDTLTRLGYQVTGMVANQKETLQSIQKVRPNLVLLDIMLQRNESGIDIGKILSRDHGLPVIFLTSYSDDDTMARAKAAEPLGYLLKPFKERELQATIEMALHKHELQREVLRQKRWLEAVLDDLAEGVLVTDQAEKIVFANRAIRDTLDTAPQSLLNRPLADFLPQHLQASPLGARQFLQTTHKTQAGREKILSYGISSVQNYDETFLGLVGTIRDETDRILAERALVRANEELIRLSQVKADFTAMISHELRTPLSAIKEGVELVLDGIDGPLSTPQQQTLSLVQNNVIRLSRLIDNVLNFSKMEAGKLDWDFQPTEMIELTREVFETMHPAASKKSLSYALHVPDGSIPLTCDAEKIRQVLFNLLDNAIKFTADGGITVRIARTETQCRIDIEDTGKGIQSEDQSRIFRLYEQVHEKGMWTTGGSGLGLALSRNIVHKHGGRIDVESRPGQGSLFTVLLPLQPPTGTSPLSS